MSRITDYSFLFQSMFGTESTNLVNSFKVSSLSSRETLSTLKAAGIDTNSKQYKAAISQMTKSASAGMCTSNGMGDGDGRAEIYTNMQRKMDKSDRLAATYTMQQYERAYTQAFNAAAKAADPDWDYGERFHRGRLTILQGNSSRQTSSRAVILLQPRQAALM